MKKIIFISGSMTRGGAERVISILSNYFVNSGWNVSIITCLHHEIEFDLDPRIQMIDISNPPRNQLADTPRMIFALKSIIKKEKPDIVLSFMVKISIITAIACRGLHVRLFMSERSDPINSRTWVLRQIGEWAYSQATAVVLQTNQVKNCFHKKVQKKSIVIPNPVTVQAYASENKEKVIVTVGRLEKPKNYKMLINAFSLFYQTHPDYRLRFYGTGTLEKKLKNQVRNLGLTDAVDFMGNTMDVHLQIKNASLFVLSSDFEGLSNALIEAMMMGLPCISTDCNGADAIIDANESGMIIRRGDTHALAEAMCKMIDDRKLAESYAAEAHRRTMSRFSADLICKQWKALVEGKKVV